VVGNPRSHIRRVLGKARKRLTDDAELPLDG
jgi:hypothetical protein